MDPQKTEAMQSIRDAVNEARAAVTLRQHRAARARVQRALQKAVAVFPQDADVSSEIGKAVSEYAATIPSYVNAKPEEGATGIFGGAPSYFRALCRTASRGGNGSYRDAAYQFASRVDGAVPHDVEDNDWYATVDVLTEALDKGDDAAAWKWFTTHYPKCMQLIPSRRKEQFIEGVKAAYRDELIGCLG